MRLPVILGALLFTAPLFAGGEPKLAETPRGMAIESEHYHFDTTLASDQKDALDHLGDLASRVDRFFDAACKELGIAKTIRGPEGFRVVVYGTRAEFQAYAQKTNYPWLSQGGGFFHIPERALYTYYRDDHNMQRVLFHEGTHQILDRLGDTVAIPVWWNEGLAVVFETSEGDPGKFDFGALNVPRLEFLLEARAKGPVPGAYEIVNLDYDHFHADSFGPREKLHYACSWALVHFILNGRDRLPKRIKAGMMGVVEGKLKQSSFLTADVASRLELGLWKHVDALEKKLEEARKKETPPDPKKPPAKNEGENENGG